MAVTYFSFMTPFKTTFCDSYSVGETIFKKLQVEVLSVITI